LLTYVRGSVPASVTIKKQITEMSLGTSMGRDAALGTANASVCATSTGVSAEIGRLRLSFGAASQFVGLNL